uniref:Metalloendopeptidase n=1 Tax=Parastrongyloides trichosuri TaxID=131310 RepID=A0A0N4Z5E0_PARTI
MRYVTQIMYYFIILFFINFLRAFVEKAGSFEHFQYLRTKTGIIRGKRAITNDMRYKWEFPIKYHVNYPVNETAIDIALKELMNETCIKFEKVDNLNESGLNYVRGGGCISFVGKISSSRSQDIGLTADCEKAANIQHETLHALGVHHEMSREDRNKYIEVLTQNVDPRVLFNFEKDPVGKAHAFGFTYDYGSIMHYSKTAGSIDPNMLAVKAKLDGYINTPGQRVEIGFNDVKLLNYHYCADKCKESEIKCDFGGYPDPHNCTRCKCPRFFEGDDCSKVTRSDFACPYSVLFPKDEKQTATLKGKMTCTIPIFAPYGKKIEMTLESSNLPGYFNCKPDAGLEIKYLEDKTVSGPIFCGRNATGTITSESRYVVMRYIGLEDDNYINLVYSTV